MQSPICLPNMNTNLASELLWSILTLLKLQWLSQTGSPTLPMFSTFCTFSTFPLAIFPVQSSVFSSSWGFTDTHVHFTHFETSKPSEEKQQFGSPWAITGGWSWPKRGCVHVWKEERALTSLGCIKTKQLLIARCQWLCLFEEFPSLTFTDKKKPTLLHLASPTSSSCLSNTNISNESAKA